MAATRGGVRVGPGPRWGPPEGEPHAHGVWPRVKRMWQVKGLISKIQAHGVWPGVKRTLKVDYLLFNY